MQIVDGELKLLVGGSAGNLTIWSTGGGATAFEPDVSKVAVELLEDVPADKFVWEGPAGFKVCFFSFSDPLQCTRPMNLTVCLYLPF